MPRSISISLGNDITISHNLLDVSEALKVEQYEHQVIKCNRPGPEVVLPATCDIPMLVFNERDDTSEEEVKQLVLKHQDDHTDNDNAEVLTDDTSIEEEIRATIDREKDIIVTVLGTVDTLGLIWIFVTVVSCSLFILGYICFCCHDRRKEAKKSGSKKTSSELRPDLLVIPFNSDDDGDEYSESSRVHLAMGPGPADPWPGLRYCLIRCRENAFRFKSIYLLCV